MNTTADELHTRFRRRLRVRLAVLRITVANLCRLYDGEIVAGYPAPPGATVRAWTIRGNINLRNIAQIAEMLGIKPELLTNPDEPDASGRYPADLICDLDAYPPPPRLASAFSSAAA